MQALLAVAELRLRGAVAARLPWLVPAAFAAGVACALGAPGIDLRSRATAADGFALSIAAAAALLSVLVLASTTFASEIRSTEAHALLSAPVSRGRLLAGGAAGHSAFGLLLLLGLGAAAAIGLDAGGLGARARGAVRTMEPAEVLGRGADGLAVVGPRSHEVRARFRVPDGVDEPTLHFRFAPRGQIETDWSPAGVVAIGVAPPGGSPSPESVRRVRTRGSVAFAADLPVEAVASGAEAEVVMRYVEGGWRLRFGEGSVEVGGPRERFATNLVLASLCLVPLLGMAACAGAAATARLGAAASTALVLALLLLVAGREVIADGARFVVEAAGREAEEHGHEGHDHHVDVTAAQVALARGALVALRAVPDVDDFWRFDDLAAGRAVDPRDLGRSAIAGALPCAVLLGASWLLVRRRELLPE
jgi:hypothetical protein